MARKSKKRGSESLRPGRKPAPARARQVRGRRVRKETPKELLERAAVAVSYRRIDEDLEGAPERIAKILRLIRKRLFRQGFNVSEIRRRLDLRSHDVTTEFRRQTGATIGRYIEDRRLECAGRLIVDTGLDFHRVADLVGYRSFKTLSDAFARRFGCRPSVYRETAGRGRRYEVPRFLAGFQAPPAGSRCTRCGSVLDSAPAVRVFERLEPLCEACARRHAPRELLALVEGAPATLLGRVLRWPGRGPGKAE